MIKFTDDRLYAKGTCNVILENVSTGDIVYQSDKIMTGSVNPSTNLNEIRAGLGNPIACMIPSDSSLAVDFDAANFDLWAKSAQLGIPVTFSAPVPTCQTIKANSEALTIDVTEGAPVAELGASEAHCYVQKVGSGSLVAVDGTAYPISASGVVSGFTATVDATYKVWYFVQKATAKKAVIKSLIDPMVVRCLIQIAVYSNRGQGAASNGTRVGWLYYTIPYLKLQADAAISGDQSNNDVTKISGQAIAYDEEIVTATCSDCDTSDLGYIVYVPDNASGLVQGLAVIGGVVTVTNGSTAQIPVKIVMVDGSLVDPADYSANFTYTLAEGGDSYASVSTAGVVTGSAVGDTEVTIEYEEGEETFECVSNVSVVTAP